VSFRREEQLVAHTPGERAPRIPGMGAWPKFQARNESMLTEKQKRRYEEVLILAREESEQLDRELAAEIARAKEKLRELQEAKKAVQLIYEGACARLGEKGDLKLPSFEVLELETHV
jgi:hypothetical protein